MRIVKGEGNAQAKLVIVGEALGELEERDGRVFHPDARAGGHLRRMLRDAGIDEGEIYLTNVVPTRPPKNKLDLLPGWERYIPDLKNRLERIRPNICVPLGATALGVLTGHERQGDITRWRGSVVESTLVPGMKVMASFHPSWLMRGQFNYTPIVVHDLKKAKEEAKFPTIIREPRAALTNPSFGQVIEFLDSLRKAEFICVDVENWPNLELGLLGIGASPNLAMSIPISSMRRIHHWEEHEEVMIWRKVLDLWRSKLIVGQNLAWDLTILSSILNTPSWILLDTMVVHSVLFPEWPHGLDFLTAWYTDLPYYKEEGKIRERGRTEQEWAEYNCKDVMATVECAQKMMQELKHDGLWSFYAHHANPLVRLYWKMSMKGIRVDAKRMQEKKYELTKSAESIKQVLERETGIPGFNPNSSKQVADLVYGMLKYRKRYKRGAKTNAPTTEQKVLEELHARKPNPLLGKILAYRHKTKLIGDKLEVAYWRKGYYHSAFNPSGTESGRLSASKFLNQFGANLQNVDPELRDIFIPEEGMVFLLTDQKQAEAAVVFWLAKDEQWKEKYDNGGDVHAFVAELCQTDRQTAKRMVHGSNYAMGPVTFAQYVGTDVKRGRALSAAYHRAMPNIRGVFHASVKDDVGRTRRLRTCWGRVRQLLGGWGEDLFKEAFSYIPQSTVGDLTHHAAMYLDQCDIDLRLNTHDGLLAQVLDNYTEIARAQELVLKAFDVPLLIGGDVLRMQVEMEVTERWK